MHIQKKAAYRLLKQHADQLSVEERARLEPWQLQDFHTKETEELLNEASQIINEPFPRSAFELGAKAFDSPEELTETRAVHLDSADEDHLYLIFFELWKRFCPEKRSLSLFCDAFDDLIDAYDTSKAQTPIEDQLSYLQEILSAHVDEGYPHREIFDSIQIFLAHDLEGFLLDFILTQIENKELEYASELCSFFQPFVKRPKWFEYMLSLSEIFDNPVKGYQRLEALIDDMKELSLAMEVLSFLSESKEHALFTKLALKTIPLVKTKKEERALLKSCQAHYHYLKKEKESSEIGALLKEGDLKPLKKILSAK